MKTILLFAPILLISCATPSPDVPIVAVKDLIATATKHSETTTNLTFDNLPAKVRARNPQLAAARNLIAEANGHLIQAGVKSNPELEMEFEADRRFRDLMLTVGVSQRFPRTNRLLLEKRTSQILVQAAAAEIRDVERQLIGEARLAFTNLVALRSEQDLIKAQEEKSRQLARFITDASVRGEASSLEAGTALLEATRLANRARQVAIRHDLALAKLKPLLGLRPTDTLTTDASLPPTTLPPMLVGSANRPDLEAARLRAQSAASATELERSRKLDDIEAGVFAGLGRAEDAPNGLESEQIIGFRVKIPFATNNQNTGNILAAEARHQRLTAEARALTLGIRAEAAAYYQEMAQWSALALQIETKLIPLADSQINLTKASYERGEAPLQDVLRAQEQRLSLKTSHLEAVRDFHLAHANYLTAIAQ
ncbi:MAG: TolC family protein [Verrucomicrobiaceae bacterium]